MGRLEASFAPKVFKAYATFFSFVVRLLTHKPQDAPAHVCAMRLEIKTECLSATYAAHDGVWQAWRASPCLHHRAKRKTPPMPVLAVLRPSFGRRPQTQPFFPQKMLGQCSFLHGFCTFHLPAPGLDKVDQYSWHVLRTSSFSS
jgi:hypothetical protein